MKKKNLNFLLALLAALALVFAGACSDGSDEAADDGTNTEETDNTGGNDGTGSGNGTGSEGGGGNNNTDNTTNNNNNESEDNVTGTVYCTECATETCTVTDSCTGQPGCEACASADPSCECDDCQKTEIDLAYFKTFVESLGTVTSGVSGADWTFTGGDWSEDNATYTLALDGNKAESDNVSASTVLGNVNSLGTQQSGGLQIAFGTVTWDDGEPSDKDPGKITVSVEIVNSGTHEFGSALNDLLDGEVLPVTLVFDITKITGGSWE